MKLEYYVHNHMGVPRKYISDKTKRMWLMKLSKHATVTKEDEKALKGLGFKLVEVKK